MQTERTGGSYKGVATAALLVAVVSLALAGYATYSSYSAAIKPAPKAPTILTYDVPITTFVVGNVSGTHSLIGNTFEAAGPVYPHGQANKGSYIGNYTCFGTITSDVAFGDTIAVQVLNMKGMGQIFFWGPEPGTPNIQFPETINGGTGQFLGASGLAYQSLSSDGTTITLTLNFTTKA